MSHLAHSPEEALTTAPGNFEKIKLWFFRDLTPEKRRALFALFGVRDTGTHTFEAWALRQIMAPLEPTRSLRLSNRELTIATIALRIFMETHYNAASDPNRSEYSARFKSLGDEAGDLCEKVAAIARAKGCDVRSSIGEIAP